MMPNQLIEVPEAVHEGMRALQQVKPSWTTDRIVTAALALWLLQETGDRAVARVYLGAMFGREL